MELDRVAVEIRPRGGWESLDLGFRLARATAVPLWGAFVPVFALFATAACLLFRHQPLLAALAIWWFKPWYDRVALHVLSRAVFGATPGITETLRALPRMFRRGAFASVLHMRFDAARSLNLAPWQLEEQRWAQWRKRVKLIESPVRGTAAWLTISCVYFELTVVVALYALAYWLIPPSLFDVSLDWGWTSEQLEQAFNWSALAVWVLAVALVEPFYVAGGFGLYLNRRTELEAWDIEIAFRRIAKRQLEGDGQAPG